MVPRTLSLKRPEHASSRQLALPGKQVSGGPWAAPIECGKGLSIPSRQLHNSMDSIVHSTRQASTSWRGVATFQLPGPRSSVCFLVGPTGVLPNVTMLASWKFHRAQYQIVQRHYRTDEDNPRLERRRLSRYHRARVSTRPYRSFLSFSFPSFLSPSLPSSSSCRPSLFRTSGCLEELITAERP